MWSSFWMIWGGTHSLPVESAATHATIVHEIQTCLMLGRKPVNIVCVGTGVEGAELAPGSEAPYYVLHRITTTNLWQQWTKKARQYAELRKVMAEPGAWSMLATAMVENARAAALFKAYVSRHLHLCTTRSSCLALLQCAVLETAFEYKSKNAAASTASASAIFEALQYPLHRLPSLANEHLVFMREYGMLTDVATFQSPSERNFKPVKFVVNGAVKFLLYKPETKPGCLSKADFCRGSRCSPLSIPANAWSRYEMSAAQLALCRVGYGVSPIATTCGGFEGTVIDFVLFALLAGPPLAKWRPLDKDPRDRHPASVLLNLLYEGETVRPTHVSVCQSHVRLDEKNSGTLGSINSTRKNAREQHF